jgi:hypothetical protein
MPTYVIERTIPGAGSMSDAEWQEIAAKSNSVIANDAPEATWLHSYVTGDKLYCVYESPGPEAILRHAQCGGFPADAVNEVKRIIDPATAG